MSEFVGELSAQMRQMALTLVETSQRLEWLDLDADTVTEAGRVSDVRQIRVVSALYVDVNTVGERGLARIGDALESACAAATEPFMRIKSGVQSWHTERAWDDRESSDSPS